MKMPRCVGAVAVFAMLASPGWAFKSDEPRDAAQNIRHTAPSPRTIHTDQFAAEDAANKRGVAVVWDKELATPASVRGPDLGALKVSGAPAKVFNPAGRGSFSTDVFMILDTVATLFRIKSVEQEFTVKQESDDDLGSRHVRLDQYCKGVRVVGGELIVHFSADKLAREVNGRYVPDVAVVFKADIDAADATMVAQSDLASRGSPAGELTCLPEPVIYAWGADPVAAWEITLWYRDPVAGSGRWRYWINAADGAILRVYNDIQRVAAPTANGAGVTITGNILSGEGGGAVSLTGWRENNGVHYLYNKINFWYVYNVAASGFSDNDTYASRNSAAWGTTDRAEMSAARNFQKTQKYFKDVHGRNSYDNANAYARANMHEGTNYVNAYWDGYNFYFGDGDNIEATPLGVADITAHEYTHAVTEYSANLYYYGESGALNESFSDVFGACVEFYSQPDGRGLYPNKQSGYADWLCGEDAWLSSKALRDMRSPGNATTVGEGNQQPSRYKGTYWYFGSGDYAGVHQNSGVQNFFFYLLSEGGSGVNDGINYSVTGIGVSNAARVAYRALTTYVGQYTDYTSIRGCWSSSAQDLNSGWVGSVEAAWAAAGVGTATPTVSIPTISPGGGAYSSTVTVTLEVATPGAAIRYTLNDTEPTESSALYLNPLKISNATTLKAKGFKSGMAASATATAIYLFLGTQIYNFPMNSAPAGWTTAGQWAFGVPTGGGGEYGYPDPAAGYTGTRVYGYNLNGDYANNIATTYWLTTAALNLSQVSNTRLVFRRWLGVERPAFDHAYVEVSNNGSTWTRVWENDVTVADNAWTNQVLNISSTADLQSSVQIRWGMGSTDDSWSYCGWNIDDVQIWGVQGVSVSVPDHPTNLQASALSWTNVQLTWQDRSSNEQGFVIRRRTGDGTWGDLVTLGANVTAYNDLSVVPATTYTYRVHAFNSIGDSEESNEAIANTPSSSGDMWDPADDVISGATVLPAPSNAEQSHGGHSLGTTDMYDWFKVFLSGGVACNFNTSGGSGDTYGLLFSDAAGTNLVASDDDSGGARQFSITYTPAVSGWFYLMVRSYSPGDESSYSLKYRRTAGDAWTLGDALNAPAYAWYTGGDGAFFGQTVVAHDTVAAVQSGGITHGKFTWLATTVTGPGVARFWWKTSSETDYDYLYFYMGGDQFTRMWRSGINGWQRRSFIVPAGAHNLYWGYTKDNSTSAGLDAGWVDEFKFTPRSRTVINDYDNDDRSDLAVYDTLAARWFIYSLRTADSLAWNRWWGAATMRPYPGDYDGDGKADLAIFNPIDGSWYIQTMAGQTIGFGIKWGYKDVVPVPGDYDGDGIDDLAVYDAMAGRWFIRTVRGTVLAWGLNWGFSGCTPVPGDYDGDGKADLAIYYPPTSAWFIRTLAGGSIAWNTLWGINGSTAVPGDFNGDGRSDLAVYHPPTTAWYIRTIYGEKLANKLSWGVSGGTPLAGDYDGDGASDLAIYDSANSRWYIFSLWSGTAVVSGFNWGTSRTMPVSLK